MAHKAKATLANRILEAALDIAGNIVIEHVRKAMPHTAMALEGMKKPKRRRKSDKQPGEIKVGKNLYYTPPPKRS